MAQRNVSTYAFVRCVCGSVCTHTLVFEWNIPETHTPACQRGRASVWCLYHLYTLSVTHFTAHCIFLLTARQRHHPPVQPPTGGLWQRQDVEKQQLQQICKAFVSLFVHQGTKHCSSVHSSALKCEFRLFFCAPKIACSVSEGNSEITHTKLAVLLRDAYTQQVLLIPKT